LPFPVRPIISPVNIDEWSRLNVPVESLNVTDTEPAPCSSSVEPASISAGNAAGVTASQTVSVTIGGPGNDSFVFHPGFGVNDIANAKSADTIELDGFSSVTSNSQLATFLHEAQTGQSQFLFQSVNEGHDNTINLGNHDSITLMNVHLTDLHASNFVIA
jgi:hypothetical protein